MMTNPINTTNLSLPTETYCRLKKIKEHKGWTFNQVVDALCELEFKNNYIEHTIEYELFYADEIYKFRVQFKKENIIIEYYDGSTFTDKISKWGVPKSIRNTFFEFIKEDCARCILLNIPVGLVFEEFDIYKVG